MNTAQQPAAPAVNPLLEAFISRAVEGGWIDLGEMLPFAEAMRAAFAPALLPAINGVQPPKPYEESVPRRPGGYVDTDDALDAMQAEIAGWRQYVLAKRDQQADNAPTPVPCDVTIYAAGLPVAILDGGMLAVQGIVQEANRTGPIMDWHYFGGRAVVKTLGDSQRAYDALKRAIPRIIDGAA